VGEEVDITRSGVAEGAQQTVPSGSNPPGPDAPARRQETFGPLGIIVSARDAEDAIAIANDTEFGLSANLWTRDLDRAASLALKIEAGGVFVNSTTASDPRFPFGGIKKSGYGRELGAEGAREFTNHKTIKLMRP